MGKQNRLNVKTVADNMRQQRGDLDGSTSSTLSTKTLNLQENPFKGRALPRSARDESPIKVSNSETSLNKTFEKPAALPPPSSVVKSSKIPGPVRRPAVNAEDHEDDPFKTVKSIPRTPKGGEETARKTIPWTPVLPLDQENVAVLPTGKTIPRTPIGQNRVFEFVNKTPLERKETVNVDEIVIGPTRTIPRTPVGQTRVYDEKKSPPEQILEERVTNLDDLVICPKSTNPAESPAQYDQPKRNFIPRGTVLPRTPFVASNNDNDDLEVSLDEGSKTFSVDVENDKNVNIEVIKTPPDLESDGRNDIIDDEIDMENRLEIIEVEKDKLEIVEQNRIEIVEQKIKDCEKETENDVLANIPETEESQTKPEKKRKKEIKSKIDTNLTKKRRSPRISNTPTTMTTELNYKESPELKAATKRKSPRIVQTNKKAITEAKAEKTHDDIKAEGSPRKSRRPSFDEMATIAMDNVVNKHKKKLEPVQPPELSPIPVATRETAKVKRPQSKSARSRRTAASKKDEDAMLEQQQQPSTTSQVEAAAEVIAKLQEVSNINTVDGSKVGGDQKRLQRPRRGKLPPASTEDKVKLPQIAALLKSRKGRRAKAQNADPAEDEANITIEEFVPALVSFKNNIFRSTDCLGGNLVNGDGSIETLSPLTIYLFRLRFDNSIYLSTMIQSI